VPSLARRFGELFVFCAASASNIIGNLANGLQEPGNGHNRVAVGNGGWGMTQGSSFLATLGFEAESLWDSKSPQAAPVLPQG
jgi:hypothetical protein